MLYRIGQGLRALFAWTRPVDYSAVEAILSPQLAALFASLRHSEQLHSLGVLESVRVAGHDHPDLLVAALLHDVGKSRMPIGLLGRTLVVLAKAFAPASYARWSQHQPRGWRRPFVVAEQHATWGADMLAAAGATPVAVSLVRRHQERLTAPQNEEDHLLAALQAADAAN